jgi:hypothetical protein
MSCFIQIAGPKVSEVRVKISWAFLRLHYPTVVEKEEVEGAKDWRWLQ